MKPQQFAMTRCRILKGGLATVLTSSTPLFLSSQVLGQAGNIGHRPSPPGF